MFTTCLVQGVAPQASLAYDTAPANQQPRTLKWGAAYAGD